MSGRFAATHQGGAQPFRQKGVAKRCRIAHHHNAVAIKTVMAVPNPQLAALTDACIGGET